jgi:hypothetical protein
MPRPYKWQAAAMARVTIKPQHDHASKRTHYLVTTDNDEFRFYVNSLKLDSPEKAIDEGFKRPLNAECREKALKALRAGLDAVIDLEGCLEPLK